MPDVPEISFPVIEPKPRHRKATRRNLAKKRKTADKQERLLRLFDGEGYEEFIPKYVFIKQWNGDTKKWQVAIFPMESYKKYKNPRQTEYQQQLSHLKDIQREV